MINFLTAAIAITSALVVTVNSPIHSVFLLILTFSWSAALLFYLGAEFLGLVYILVYIGAIAVLFLFIVMMLNLREQQTNHFNFVYLITFLSISEICASSVAGLNTFQVYDTLHSNIIYLQELDNMKLLGIYFYTIQPLAIILIGFILLVSMIGSILYTLQHYQATKRQSSIYNSTFFSSYKKVNIKNLS